MTHTAFSIWLNDTRILVLKLKQGDIHYHHLLNQYQRRVILKLHEYTKQRKQRKLMKTV